MAKTDIDMKKKFRFDGAVLKIRYHPISHPYFYHTDRFFCYFQESQASRLHTGHIQETTINITQVHTQLNSQIIPREFFIGSLYSLFALFCPPFPLVFSRNLASFPRASMFTFFNSSTDLPRPQLQLNAESYPPHELHSPWPGIPYT